MLCQEAKRRKSGTYERVGAYNAGLLRACEAVGYADQQKPAMTTHLGCLNSVPLRSVPKASEGK